MQRRSQSINKAKLSDWILHSVQDDNKRVQYDINKKSPRMTKEDGRGMGERERVLNRLPQ